MAARSLVWNLLDTIGLLWRDATPPGVLRLSHGDTHVGNAVWCETGLVGVLDWESSRMAPPEWDAATLYRWAEYPGVTGGAAATFLGQMRQQGAGGRGWRLPGQPSDPSPEPTRYVTKYSNRATFSTRFSTTPGRVDFSTRNKYT